MLFFERGSLGALGYVWRHRRGLLAIRWLVQARAARGWAGVGSPAPAPVAGAAPAATGAAASGIGQAPAPTIEQLDGAKRAD